MDVSIYNWYRLCYHASCFARATSSLRLASPVFSRSTLNCRRSTSPLPQRVRINIIPFHLAILCFHTLTHSFALRKLLTLVLSVACALSVQNTGGGVSPSRLLVLDASDPSPLPYYLLLTTHHSPPAVHCTPPPPSNLFGAQPHA